MLKFLISLLLFLYSFGLSGQIKNKDNFGIKRPKSRKVCSRLIHVLNALPKEARFSSMIHRGDSLFLAYNSQDWFNKIIVNKRDGIAIDLVSSDQYECNAAGDNSPNWLNKGYLVQPVYRNDLIENRRELPNGIILSYAGKIPESLYGKKLEANFMVLQNRQKCYYSNVVSIDYHSWKLLTMGFYYDTLSSNNMLEKYASLSKTITFFIPFDKNKSSFKVEDIRPLYDSLRLTDYVIKSINIAAYTSVEGSYSRNMELQEERAQSMVKALQTYQNEKIVSSISTDENWVEFLEDIDGSIYDYFMTLSKEEIKEKLKSKELLARLEPILKKERKAIYNWRSKRK